MADIDLMLPDELAHRCTQSAQALGISSAELVCMALEHELADINRCMARAAMTKALKAMQDDPDYEQAIATLDESAMVCLPDEPEKWWQC